MTRIIFFGLDMETVTYLRIGVHNDYFFCLDYHFSDSIFYIW